MLLVYIQLGPLSSDITSLSPRITSHSVLYLMKAETAPQLVLSLVATRITIESFINPQDLMLHSMSDVNKKNLHITTETNVARTPINW